MLSQQKIIGHQEQVSQLENDLKGSNLTHAYLFFGPKSLGKSLVAKNFAKALLCCESLCSQCQSCLSFEKGVHADFVEWKDEGESIKIDAVRSLNAKIHLSPQGKRRVVFIENIERMPTEAQNAFLKSLEEPGESTIFILTSSQIKQVLPTIISRVRSHEFNSVPRAKLEEGIKERGAEPPSLQAVLDMAQGKPGKALDLLENPGLFAENKQAFSQIKYFLSQNGLIEKFMYVETIEKEPQKLDQFFEGSALVIKEAMSERLLGKKSTLIKRYNLEELGDLFEKLVKTRYLTKRNVNKKLALENFFLATEK